MPQTSAEYSLPEGENMIQEIRAALRYSSIQLCPHIDYRLGHEMILSF